MYWEDPYDFTVGFGFIDIRLRRASHSFDARTVLGIRKIFHPRLNMRSKTTRIRLADTFKMTSPRLSNPQRQKNCVPHTDDQRAGCCT